MGLCFNRGEKVYSLADSSYFPNYYIFGHTDTYVDTCFSSLNLIIVIFRPMGAKTFFNIPLNRLKGLSVSLDMLDNPLFSELGKRVMETKDNHICIELIEAFLLKSILQSENYNRMRMLSAMNAMTRGETDVDRLAALACLGYKQFQRIFTEYIGLRPKEYIRINRFSKTLQSLQTGTYSGLSELADECGYYDKSHLIKEVKSLSGYTPRGFLSNSDPYSDYRSVFQSVCVDIKGHI